jgi:PAS domain S-box-containing protein
VVFLTALKGDKAARIRALEVGAEAFLSKPIDEIELTAQIQAMQKIKAASARERAEKENLTDLVAAQTRKLELAHADALNLLEDLKKENTARQESEAHLRLLFENLPSGVVVHAASTAVLFANPEALRLLGLTLEQVQGKTATDPAWCFLRDDGGLLALEDYPVNRVRASGKPFAGQIIGIRLPGRAEPNWVQYSAYPLLDASGQISQVIVAFTDITARKQAGEALKRIEWLLTSRPKVSDNDIQAYTPPYGNLVALNTCRLILDSVGEQTLADIVRDYLHLLDTSSAVYEKNGDYALGIFSSGWCRTLDAASRRACGTTDNRTALDCGQWHCHESCWSRASKTAIETGQPADIECDGGLRLYAVPIRVRDEIIGAINIGYGDPPRDEEKLRELASRYQVSHEELRALSMGYESRPAFITDLAKDRLQASARLIGVIIERKQTEKILRESEERFKAIANYAVSWESWFGPEGKYIWVNPAVEHFTGYSAQEILALPDFVSTVIADEDRAVFMGRFQEAIRGSREDNFEFRYLHKNGTTRWLNASWQPIYDAQGKPLGTRSSGYDITAQKDREAHMALLVRMLDDAPAAITIHDTSGRFLFSNRQNILLHGFASEEEFISVNLHDLDTPESEALLAERVQQIAERGAARFGVTHRRKDGSTFPLDVTAKVIDWRGRQAVLSIALDITARKQAEEDLQRKQAMLAQTEALANVGSWEWAVATDTVIWSDELFRIFRRDPDLGAPPFAEHASLYPPEDFRRLNQVVEAALREGTPYEIELHALCMDGEIRTCLAHGQAEKKDGRVVRLSGFLQDITARKRAEDALRESEQRHRDYLAHSPYGVFVADEQGRCVQVNPAACSITGYSEKELLSKSVSDLHGEESREDATRHFQAVVHEGKATGELKFRPKSGESRWWLVSAVKISDTRFLGFCNDITDRKEADAKLNEQLDELRRWQVVTLGREERVQELKREVNEACRRLGEPARYTDQETGAPDSGEERV